MKRLSFWFLIGRIKGVRRAVEKASLPRIGRFTLCVFVRQMRVFVPGAYRFRGFSTAPTVLFLSLSPRCGGNEIR